MYLDNYKEIPTTLKHRTRFFLRNKALDILALKNNLTKLNTPRIQFLYFHHVFKNEELKLELILKELLKSHIFISYSDAIKKLEEGNIDKPYICLSSDDGFKNNLRSSKVFKEFGISACYFICPTIINNKNFEDVKAFCEKKLHLPPVEFLDWKDVEAMQKDGHEIGSHTMNHFKLSTLKNSDIDYELETSKTIIEFKTGNLQTHFAFPYGLKNHINDYAINKVFDIGYSSCASAIRGAHFSKTNIKHSLIKRDQIIFEWKQSHINYFLLKNCDSKIVNE